MQPLVSCFLSHEVDTSYLTDSETHTFPPYDFSEIEMRLSVSDVP